MKKIVLTLLLVLPFLFNSCKKEPIPQPPQQIINLLVDEEPQALVDELELTLSLPEVTDINVEDALITDYPEFLDYDPFTVITARTNSADSCVRDLEVSKLQKEQLRKAFLDKIECQKQNKAAIAKIHRGIESWSRTQKENYYTNWYLVEKEKLDDSLKRGSITRTKHKEKMDALEKSWKNKMDYLNSQVREKIKSNVQRTEAAGKIKDCEKIYLESVITILGRGKYQKWISRYKHHYKKRR